jgi:tryptophan-rich sensory protein
MFSQTFKNLPRWQIAIGAIVISAIGGLAGMQSSKKGKRLYNKKLKQAPWAPPDWLFGPAWTVNNFFLLLALQKIVNSDAPQKHRLMALQLAIWLIFFSFGYVYFKKKSPVLAAIWTKADHVLALSSFLITRKMDKKLAAYYLPLLAWTGFASTLADYQALRNNDPVLKTKALLP